jgi:hemolysin activation/secretion protein
MRPFPSANPGFSRYPKRLPAGGPGAGFAVFRALLLWASFLHGTAMSAGQGGYFFISEYRVHGVHSITSLDVEKAVYPFLGPDRTAADVQAACRAVEKAYGALGFGAVSVHPVGLANKSGVVELQVTEGTVGRLRVKNARYFSPAKIKEAAPALAEGRVLNFNDINSDVVGLNQLHDRTITPTLRPGAEPGTYDVDLNVKDSRPFHASAEVNDYYTPNTKPLRLTASVSDTNLWQAGEGAGFSFEEAPQRRLDSEVFSGYFLGRFPGNDWLSLMLQGTKQDSNISTLGGSTVAGPGETFDLRANMALPNGKDWSTGKDWENFSQSVSLSIDYKHFKQSVNLAPSTTPGAAASTGTIVTPITYYPVSAGYAAVWGSSAEGAALTLFDASATFNLRGMGSGPREFDLNRFGADGSFIYLRSDLSRAQPLPGGWEAYAKVQGQLSNQPLVSSEESSGGGEQTVRGYLESEVVGDDGIFGTFELRTPSLLLTGKQREWKFFVFADAGKLKVIDPLAEQDAHYSLASVGIGSRLSLFDHVSGACDLAYPLIGQTYTQEHELQFRFRVGLDY